MKLELSEITVTVKTEQEKQMIEQFCDERGFCTVCKYRCTNHSKGEIDISVAPAGPVDLTINFIVELQNKIEH